MTTKNALEQLCPTWFKDLGWSYLYGPDISPDSENPLRESLSPQSKNRPIPNGFVTRSTSGRQVTPSSPPTQFCLVP
jgi:hypothetical protein